MATLSHGDQKRLASMKFAPILKEKVDLNLVKIEVIQKHIENTLPKYLPDEILVQTFIESLNVGAGETLNPQHLQLGLEALIGPKPAAEYTEELWRLLLSAQESKTGVAQEIIKAKVADLRKAQNSDERDVGRRANDSRPEQQPSKSRREEGSASTAGATGDGDEQSIANQRDSLDLPRDRARAPRNRHPRSRSPNRAAPRRTRSRSPAPRDRSFSPRKRPSARRGRSPASRNTDTRPSEPRRRSPVAAPQLRARKRDPRGRASRSPPDLRNRARRNSTASPSRSRSPPPYRRARRSPSPRGYDSYRPAIYDYRDERSGRHEGPRRAAERRKHRYSSDEESVAKRSRKEREGDTGKKEKTGRKEAGEGEDSGERGRRDTATSARRSAEPKPGSESVEPEAAVEKGVERKGVENGVGDESEKVEKTAE